MKFLFACAALKKCRPDVFNVYLIRAGDAKKFDGKMAADDFFNPSAVQPWHSRKTKTCPLCYIRARIFIKEGCCCKNFFFPAKRDDFLFFLTREFRF